MVSSREYAKKHVWRRKKPERKIEDAPTSDQGEEKALTTGLIKYVQKPLAKVQTNNRTLALSGELKDGTSMNSYD